MQCHGFIEFESCFAWSKRTQLSCDYDLQVLLGTSYVIATIMVAIAMAICIQFPTEIGQAVLSVLMAAAILPSVAIVPAVSLVLLVLASCTMTGRRLLNSCWVRCHPAQHDSSAIKCSCNTHHIDLCAPIYCRKAFCWHVCLHSEFTLTAGLWHRLMRHGLCQWLGQGAACALRHPD